MKTKKTTEVPSKTAPVRARAFGTSIEISADSMQVYAEERDLHQGPTVLEMRCAAAMLPAVLSMLPPTGNPVALAAREEILENVVYVLRTMGLLPFRSE